MSARILVVEDDSEIRDLIRYNLAASGYEVDEADDGARALEMLRARKPALAVVDWMLPSVSGIEVCQAVRRSPELRDVPIIVLTARGEERDRLKGFSAGADDYVVKPFSTAELVARVKAVLARGRGDPEDEGTLSYRDLELDPATHRVRRAGRSVHLGPTEFRILRQLMRRPGRVFSRRQLLDLVWGENIYVEERTVDVHIRRLRKALNGPGAADLIRTVRSAGYALDAESS